MSKLGLALISAILGSFFLAGCNPEVGGSADCSGPPVDCKVRGEIRLPFSASGMSASQHFYPSTVVLDFSQSSVGIPGSGFVTFTAIGASGAPVAMTSTTFTQSGGIGHLSNPSAVHSWLQGVTASIDRVEAEVSTPITVAPGMNSINLAVSHNNQFVVAAGETWFRGSCDTGPLVSEFDCIE
jgi:hypothetical protein